jgi:putative endopeptidase
MPLKIGDLQKYLISVTKEGENNFYGWGVDADLKDSKMNAVYLGDASLVFGRDYYQKVNEKNTEALQIYKICSFYVKRIRIQKC